MIWFEPVSWLKMTLLPTFALPAKAMVMCFRLAHGFLFFMFGQHLVHLLIFSSLGFNENF